MTCRHTRYGYPYRAYRLPSRGGNGNAGKIAGIAAGIFLATALSAHAATAHHRHPAGRRTVTTTAAVAAPVTSGSETAFWRAMLADLGAPPSQANLASLDAWRPREQPWPSLAQWNPLDSILPMPGSWNFNSFGGGLHVQNYPTAAEGAQADAQTLANGYYPLIVAALRSGSGLCGNSSLAGEFGTWSGNGYYGVC